MSKKRKTRKEKEAVKLHKFTHVKTNIVTKVKKDVDPGTPEKIKEQSNIAPYVYKDLKKVTLITGVIILFVVTVWILAYHTSIFQSFFDKLNVKY